jgi:hypothetical protein
MNVEKKGREKPIAILYILVYASFINLEWLKLLE